MTGDKYAVVVEPSEQSAFVMCPDGGYASEYDALKAYMALNRQGFVHQDAQIMVLPVMP